jgi:CSLREA domain-containing protein
MKASRGMLIRPTLFIRFIPSLCFLWPHLRTQCLGITSLTRRSSESRLLGTRLRGHVPCSWAGMILGTRWLVLACVLSALAALASGAAGQSPYGPDFIVTTLDDADDGSCDASNCTLREAINAANGNPDVNTIKFAPGLRGTIYTSSPAGLTISTQVLLLGPGARLLTISGQKEARIFDIGGPGVLIQGVTLAEGQAAGEEAPANCGGAILNSAAALTLRNCAFRSNSATAGGAIYNTTAGGNGQIQLVGCALTENVASSGGGRRL